MHNITLPTNDDFDELQQKLEQLRLLLLEIEKGIKAEEPIENIYEHIEKAKLLRDECDALKREIKYKITKNIN